MLFFSEALQQFNKGFSYIFGLGNEENDLEDKGQNEEGRTEGVTETVTAADKQFALMSQMKAYSDFTNTEWNKVWDVNIIEFFQMLAFIKEYKRKEQEAIRKYQRLHKW